MRTLKWLQGGKDMEYHTHSKKGMTSESQGGFPEVPVEDSPIRFQNVNPSPKIYYSTFSN